VDPLVRHEINKMQKKKKEHPLPTHKSVSKLDERFFLFEKTKRDEKKENGQGKKREKSKEHFFI
jgi:hypothetical protein